MLNMWRHHPVMWTLIVLAVLIAVYSLMLTSIVGLGHATAVTSPVTQH